MTGGYPFATSAKDIPGFDGPEAAAYHVCKECDTGYESAKPLLHCYQHYNTTAEELREECVALKKSQERLLKENTKLELDLAAARGELFRLRKLLDAQDAGKAVA